jgi:hypothetical protein
MRNRLQHALSVLWRNKSRVYFVSCAGRDYDCGAHLSQPASSRLRLHQAVQFISPLRIPAPALPMSAALHNHVGSVGKLMSKAQTGLLIASCLFFDVIAHPCTRKKEGRAESEQTTN